VDLLGCKHVDANSLAHSRDLTLALPLPRNAGDANVDAAVAPVALEIFGLRCWARAKLVVHGMISLQEGVDGLQDMAVSTGLVDLLGQDAIQAIMAKAFNPWRDRTC
jgi:hypothetical protein